jgi:hypothetical protein
MTNLSGIEGGNDGVPFGLDSRGLGRLRKVAEARDVWRGEASDFTPWLAENLDVLGEELGLTLNLVATEVSVGDFRLDIRAETPDGRTVIIENQLERTDHSHLGQILIYASGLEANTVVWVAPTFRDEYRRALDWLNERTDAGVDFVGVEVSVVQIGDGPRAPVFEVVARPNDWQKSVKSGSGTSKSAGGLEITPLNAQRQEFFAQVLLEVTNARPSIRMPSRSKSSWMAFAAGPFGNWDVSVVQDKRTRVEAYIDTGYHDPNKQLFDELAAETDVWEAKCGVPLAWERLDNARACRIAAYHAPVDLDDPTAVAQAQEWAIKTVIGMYDAMNDRLRNRASELRKLAKVTPAASSVADL